MLLSVHPTDRGILAATLALAVAATLALAAATTVALTSGYTERAGWLLPDAPPAIDGAQAATARASPTPVPARHKRDALARATTSTVGDQRGVVLYLLIEAGTPRPLFAR